MADYRTRFAPSPTGPLHLGHAFSALTAYDRARLMGGDMLLRIEDIDRTRCRAEWEARIFDDLHWLGIGWPEPVMRQSARQGAHAAALGRLGAMGVTYPCRCTRADIRAALSAPQEGVASRHYPGTCRGRPFADAGPDDAIRLDAARAMALAGPIAFTETGPLFAGRHLVELPEDVVLSRRDLGTAYHLAVVVDDAAQDITEVVRGADLFEATFVQRLLQTLLQYPAPTYWHHDLIRDDTGKRLAKRDDARAIAQYRADGLGPADVRRLVGL